MRKGPVPNPSRRSLLRPLAALVVIAFALLAYLGASRYQPLSLIDRGGGWLTRPNSPLADSAVQILITNGGPFGVDVVSVRPQDRGNVALSSDVLAPCRPSSDANTTCTFDVGLAPVLTPLKDLRLAPNHTIYLEHALTYDCSPLVPGDGVQISSVALVTYHFAWFTHTIQLNYHGDPSGLTYPCSSKY